MFVIWQSTLTTSPGHRRNNEEDMTTGIANSNTTDEAQLSALIDDRAQAVRDKNVNEAISSMAPNIVSYENATLWSTVRLRSRIS